MDVVKVEGVDVAAADFVKRGTLIASNLQPHKKEEDRVNEHGSAWGLVGGC